MIKPELISLFCGPGGMDEGFRQAGFATTLAYDIDSACVETFRFNHPQTKVQQADLSLLEADAIVADWNQTSPDLSPVGVIGGPPCQSFSISNVYQRDSDPRHLLLECYARILADLNNAFNLRFFVFENVPGLLAAKHIRRFERFTKMCEDAGFRVFMNSLNAQDFGVAQIRKRVFVIGINHKLYPSVEEFTFPTSTFEGPMHVRQVIEDLPEPAIFSRALSPSDIPHHPNHWCMAPKSPKFTNGMLNSGKVVGRSFRVLGWDQPSSTIAYGHREVHIHPNMRRRLSIFEAMLLQGFPETYKLKGTLSDQIRLVSEAVSPPVAREIAKAITEQLDIQMTLDVLS